jgi:DNA-binding transcriptional LysR family regulator
VNLHSSLLLQLDAVARAGSIRGAADRLHVAASSINRRLIQLEESLGVALFARTPQGMRLTAAGEIVIAHVRQTLREEARMARRLQEVMGLRGARVRVSAVQGLTDGLLPRLILSFHDLYPAVQVTVRARIAGDVETDLASGEADIGLAYALPDTAGLPDSRAFRTRLGAVVAPGHALAGRSDLRLSDLDGWPLAIADETLSIHPLITDAFDRAGLRLAPRYQTNSVGMLKYLTATGAAVTFLSRIDVDEDQRAGRLVWVPILGQELRSHELRLAHRRGSAVNPAIALFEEHLRTDLAAIVHGGPHGPGRVA